MPHLKHWIFAGAHAARKQSSWSYCFRDLKWLVEQLETHKDSDMPVRLIIIDTLRAVMDLAGLDSGIGPMTYDIFEYIVYQMLKVAP